MPLMAVVSGEVERCGLLGEGMHGISFIMNVLTLLEQVMGMDGLWNMGR